MATYESMVLTKTNAAKTLGWDRREIDKLGECPTGVKVTHIDGSIEIITKKALMDAFVASRKEKASRITTVQDSECGAIFWASSESGNSNYRVMASKDGVHCSCPDYANQLEVFGIGACGHGYAVLFSMGFYSLKDYRTAWKHGGSLSKIIESQKAKNTKLQKTA